MAALSPFSFSSGASPVHRLHPLSKLAALLALSLASSSAPAWALLPLAAAASGSLAAAGAAMAMRELAAKARFLLPLAVFVLVFRVVDLWRLPVVSTAEILPAILYVARLLLVFLFAESYFRSTSSAELAAATSVAARRLFRRNDIDPGLYLSLAVSFIPRCLEAWSRTREAAFARGYGGRRGGGGGGRQASPWVRLRSSLALLESFIAASIRGALETADALEARCYIPTRSQASRRFSGADLALVAVSTLAAVLSLAAGS